MAGVVVGQCSMWEVLPHGLAVQVREQGVPGAVVQVEAQSEKVVVVQQAAVLWLLLVEQQSLPVYVGISLVFILASAASTHCIVL